MAARILVVEDNPANLFLMCYLLQAFGYSPSTASEGPEAIPVARRDNPDLIICDIQLPKMDGYQVIRILRSESQFHATPIIAVTAMAMMGDRERMLAAGFNGYIPKPIDPETFVSQIEAFLPVELRSNVRIAKSAPARKETRAEPGRNSALILVVDDHRDNRALARSLLEPYGCRVIEATGLKHGFELALETIPDLILSDVHFGDGSGFDLIERVRGAATLTAVPSILISASAPNREERILATKKEITLLIRPIESARLLAEIESLLPAGSFSRPAPSGPIDSAT